MTAANRGKGAEDAVKKALLLNTSADFSYARWPDFHAGSRQPAPADFISCCQGRLTLLEVKEVASASRLPYKNFDPAQIARMRSWVLSGATAYGLVYFTTSEKWFLAGIDWFHRNRITELNGKPVASWDMSKEKLWDRKELAHILKTYL